MSHRTICVFAMIAGVAICGAAYANDAVENVRDTGVSGLWILANLSYAGMRAQAHPNAGWRILSFIFGFPGTFLSWFVIIEGSEHAYGVDIPRRRLL